MQTNTGITAITMKKLYLTILILFFSVRSEAQTWNLLWSDEFNSGSINASAWTFDTGGGGWGNNELEYYTNRPENARIENGNLLIIGRQESYNGSAYTSARLKTQGLRSFTYGKIEASIKLPVGQGLWPAFWLLGENISTVGWPRCGEIDIMEHINADPNIYGTMHWDNNGHVSYGGHIAVDSSNAYHLYSIVWNPLAIQWFLDGNKYWEGNISDNINSTEEFHLPFFIILNMAIGGSWPGNPDGTTHFPDTMYVDYVRVYQLSADNIEDKRDRVPDHFDLLQNYPNPFNSSTTIRFRIPTASFVELKIFDLLGRVVATLASEELPAGNHVQLWDAPEKPSGMYLYRLSAMPSEHPAGQIRVFTDTKKLILLR